MYFTNKQKFEDGRIEKMQTRVKSLKDSLATMSDANYFSLESNNSALSALGEGHTIEQLTIKVRDALYALNDTEKGSSLVPYPPIGGRPFTISKFKILNDRWIIADFSNNINDGQVIIKYFIEDDGKITFETAETVLYSEN